MKQIKNTLTKTYKYFAEQKTLFLTYLSISFINYLLTAFMYTLHEPYNMVANILVPISIYALIGYIITLPAIIYNKTQSVSIMKLLGLIKSNTNKIFKIIIFIFAFFIPLIIIYYFISKQILNTDIFSSDYTNPAPIGEFGFFPVNATIYAITELIFGFLFILPAIYMLNRTSLATSLKRSVIIYIKNLGFFIPVVSLYAIFLFFTKLFVPDNNYYAYLILSPIDAAINMAIYTTCLFFYIAKYGKSIKETTGIQNAPEIKKSSKFIFWFVVLILIGFLEIVLLLTTVIIAYYMNLNFEEPVTAFSYLISAIILPIITIILALKINSTQRLIIPLSISLILLLVTAYNTPEYNIQDNQANIDTNVMTKITSKELMSAINKERSKNNVNQIVYDDSVCAIAKVRIDDVLEKGTAVISDKASFQRALDKARMEFKSANWDQAPDWLVEYVSYQENTQDAIKKWHEEENTSIFTEDKYKSGCITVKEGFSLLIVGYNNPPVLNEKKYDINSPIDFEEYDESGSQI